MRPSLPVPIAPSSRCASSTRSIAPPACPEKDDDLAVEYTLDLLRRFELTTDQQRRIAAYCASKGIRYLCTPWDATSVATLETFGVEAYKVASADLTNLPLLAKLAADRKDADRLDRHEHDRGNPGRRQISR